jgi:hypothetical protein
MMILLVFMCFFTSLQGALLQTQFIFTQNSSKLVQYVFASGYKCTYGETYRTPEQALFYAHVGKGIVNSNHCERLAIDLNLFSLDGKYLNDYKSYEKFGLYWEKLNKKNEWGGRWKHRFDLNHFEMDL